MFKGKLSAAVAFLAIAASYGIGQTLTIPIQVASSSTQTVSYAGLKINDSNGHAILLNTAPNINASYNLVLPANLPNGPGALTTDVNGNLAWTLLSNLGSGGGTSGSVAGVSTFNGRAGTIVPALGDYTASQITGLGTAALQPSNAFDPAGSATNATSGLLSKASNLSDLSSASVARSNLGLTSGATQTLATYSNYSNGSNYSSYQTLNNGGQSVFLGILLKAQALFSENLYFDGSSWQSPLSGAGATGIRLNSLSATDGIQMSECLPGTAGALTSIDTTCTGFVSVPVANSHGTIHKFNLNGQTNVPTLGTFTVLTVNPDIVADSATTVQINTLGAAEKALVLQQVSGATANPFEVQSYNGTKLATIASNGALTVPSVTVAADPTTGLQLATKNYVDNKVASGGGTGSATVTTPASVILKGNSSGNGFVSAVAGVDYVAPNSDGSFTFSPDKTTNGGILFISGTNIDTYKAPCSQPGTNAFCIVAQGGRPGAFEGNNSTWFPFLSTAADIQTAILALPGCAQAGAYYSPVTNTCSVPGGSTATSQSDFFTGSGVLGSNWVSTTATSIAAQPVSALNKSGGNVAPATANTRGLSIYAGITFNANQKSQLTMTYGTANSGFSGPCVRMSNSGTGYCWVVGYGNAIVPLTNGASGSSLAVSGGCPSVGAGQVAAISASGTTITCTNVTTGATASVTDTQFSSGQPAIMDDIEGGITSSITNFIGSNL